MTNNEAVQIAVELLDEKMVFHNEKAEFYMEKLKAGTNSETLKRVWRNNYDRHVAELEKYCMSRAILLNEAKRSL